MFPRRKIRSTGIRGQAAIEFLLVILFLFILVVSMLELILMMHAYNTLADSAKEGIRYAIVHGTGNSTSNGPSCPCSDIDGPQAPGGTVPGYGSGYGVVKTFAGFSLHDTTAMTVTADYNPNSANGSACNKPGCMVKVTVRYPYQPFFGLGWPTVTIYAAASGRIVN